MKQHLPQAKRVLVLSPHPDDEALGCGGAIQLLVRRGSEVTIAHVTSGERIHGKPAADIAEKRVAEAREVSRLLGCKAPVFLNLPDGGLCSEREALDRELTKVVGRLEPDLILAPSPTDFHSDHIAVSLASLRLYEKLDNFILAFYEIYSTLRFTHLLDITDVMEGKKEAISKYESSLYGDPGLFIAALTGLNMQRAIFTHKHGFFEAFWLIESPVSHQEIRDWMTFGF
jgi:N-acetylglucosamine malate deacetylase 1